jgi:hypothetical protein
MKKGKDTTSNIRKGEKLPKGIEPGPRDTQNKSTWPDHEDFDEEA